MTQASPEQHRSIGHETFAVKAFREVFVARALKAGTLKEDLDAFLATVKSSPGARSIDKKYAEIVYHETMLRLGGAIAPPDSITAIAPVAAVDNSVEFDIDEFMAGTRSAYAPSVSDVAMDDDPNAFLAPSPVANPSNPFLVEGSPLRTALAAFVGKTEHPFIRSVMVSEGFARPSRFVIVGTALGTIQSGPGAGKKVNVNCTVVPHRKLRDVPEDILVHLGGRPICLFQEDAQGFKKFVFAIRHRPGLKIRFWASIGGQGDDPNGVRFVVLTDDDKGWKLVSRAEF